MKRWLSLGIVVAFLIAALILSQSRKPHADVGPDAVLHFIGDTERELSRIPFSATRISDADEIRIGNELAERYKSLEALNDKGPKANENADFRRYIEQVGATVAACASRKLPYKFHYIPESYMVNAFAIPGGHVYIGKGLIDLMDSEDELAAVLGHEIEHIDRRHAVERLQAESRLRHLGLFRLLVELPLEIFQAGYSKEQELEADRERTRLAVISGYSPTGAIRIFEAFERRFHEAQQEQAKSPQEEAARVVLATMGGYFRSHPPSHERIAQIRSLIAQENWAARSERPFELAFLLWTDQSQTALQQHKYKEAAGLAARALSNHPAHEPALRIKADAEFYQANFRQAADTYRDLLKLQPSNLGYIQFFAFMLASSDRHTAAQNFSDWIKSSGITTQDATDSLAALQILNGEAASADQIHTELRSRPDDPKTPDRLAWIAWWYYVAGESSRAFEMLESAHQQRPGNPAYAINFAWTAIDQHRYQQALDILQNARNTSSALSTYPPNERTHAADQSALAAETAMATAIANWLAQDKDQALGSYQTAIDREPSWKNSAWYTPQYSSLVSRTIAEMKTELDLRKKAVQMKSSR